MENIESNIQKVVGGTEDQQDFIYAELQSRYSSAQRERYQNRELIPSQGENEMIDYLFSVAPNFLNRYGAVDVPYNKDKIHILKPGTIREISKGLIGGGSANEITSEIEIERARSPISFLMGLSHEVFHTKGYKSVQAIGKSYGIYRSGLSIAGRGSHKEYMTRYFGQLEEALIEKVNQQFYKEVVVHNREFQDQIELLQKFKNYFHTIFKACGYSNDDIQYISDRIYDIPKDDLEYLLDMLEPSNPTMEAKIDEEYASNSGNKSRDEFANSFKAGFIMGFMDKDIGPRVREQKKLEAFIDKIHRVSEGKYSKDEIFQKFAEAHFTGKLLPLARMIDEVLGKGAFRELAEDTKESYA